MQAPGRKGGRAHWLVPASFEVDEEKRHLGTVDFYSKLQGYGFIHLKEEGVVPENRLFVHWRNIESEDRFPFLTKDLEVEFSVLKWREQGGQVSLRAQRVTLPGGASIALQDAEDRETKDFVESQSARYTGILKFYDTKKGFGYVTIDSPPAGIQKDIMVDRSEINMKDKQPQWMENIVVECGIFRNENGQARAYNVMPHDRLLTPAASVQAEKRVDDSLDNRVVIKGQKFSGRVQIWNGQQRWGFIDPDTYCPLPPQVKAKLAEQAAAAKHRAEARGHASSAKSELLYFRGQDVVEGTSVQVDTPVMFQLYTDDKGAGACHVEPI
eukprot:gnl/TRDRNA2_/TRDRNA2_192729_c0_seq1.p1 gnl/TRDRNA2_/TRDRNA2_192729_c0~~gnl/TRDRNA2_/TRDRNA2_192729_c0_seq1.p1  ORF type:complete len:326 (+),score=63.32 gnl/TRDRNA2_/TRDRNA2_192729_c0_seq1:66-1043(+)